MCVCIDMYAELDTDTCIQIDIGTDIGAYRHSKFKKGIHAYELRHFLFLPGSGKLCLISRHASEERTASHLSSRGALGSGFQGTRLWDLVLRV